MREKKILIIDDEKRMADSIARLLRDAAFHVATAYGGREGLARLKKECFQVVVTDLRMQDVGGLDVIRHIHEHYPRVLTIVITGHASTDSAIEAVRCQVFDYLRKPFEFALLRMAVERAFQKIEIEQLREDCAAMITHDIKIPLTSIIGFASMLYDEGKGGFHERTREFGDTILLNGKKILDLIENFLTTCQLDAGTLQVVPSRIDLKKMIREAIDSAEPEAAHHDHKIVLKIEDKPLIVHADEMLLYRAINNLVHNALKYSAPGAPITVRAGRTNADDAAAPAGDAIVVEVVNPAHNIEEKDLAEIFIRYKRVRVDSGIEGAGIGLYVVQAVAKAHHGDVAARMLPDGRVRFAMYIPSTLPDQHEK